jgi:RNA:NAD 2'-phosphotransferase (TPT1/KptA family)
LEDQQCDKQLADFAQKKKRTFSGKFASVALRNKSSLKEIRITFTPLSYTSVIIKMYPWDRMDARDRQF